MSDELKHKEEELRLLLRKVDSEISHFEGLKRDVDARREGLEGDVKNAGLQPVPIEIIPSRNSESNVERELMCHLLELNKIKNFINAKLKTVLSEGELLKKLRGKYGKDIGIRKVSGGAFELTFSDASIKDAYKDLEKSRKMLLNIKETVHKISEQSTS